MLTDNLSQDHYVGVEKVGVRAEAMVILKALPLVQESTLEWETPKTFQAPITTTSNEAGYQLIAKKVSDSELEVQMVLERATKEDLGRHILSLRNQLGAETYKVSSQLSHPYICLLSQSRCSSLRPRWLKCSYLRCQRKLSLVEKRTLSAARKLHTVCPFHLSHLLLAFTQVSKVPPA